MDDGDKVRRNLVVASSITMLLAWLQVPLVSVVDRLFGTKAEGYSPTAWRVWVAVLAVLMYLALRFRFSHEVEEGMKAFRDARRQRYRALYQRHLKDLEELATQGTLAPGPFREEVETPALWRHRE
ncbi:hypothetical protein H6CHR_03428 [Variovorax sp. PBL-H6]|nr:hypothetical protein H6CHR_03428 [Variovorax sp. PBL-H6]